MAYQYTIPEGKYISLERAIREANELHDQPLDFILLTTKNKQNESDLLLLANIALFSKFQLSDEFRLGNEIFAEGWGFDCFQVEDYARGQRFLLAQDNTIGTGYRGKIFSSHTKAMRLLLKPQIEAIRAYERKTLIKVHTI